MNINMPYCQEMYKKMPGGFLLAENAYLYIWRNGEKWGAAIKRLVHYESHKSKPHILLFRRAKGTDP